ncbi:iron-siderophore ABC transporter substrate-binding protein [Enterococcus sp. OL5]|uniref:iron-siderophore ABC transporter substrate-binding protein n=1 Tax=Enterococcus sp. OL5 TaxID=2590214 RepID=UPI0016780D2A|nr:iron-siderophore ABC transporter substrate-binding protein [Enterococcus sp. OL5]
MLSACGTTSSQTAASTAATTENSSASIAQTQSLTYLDTDYDVVYPTKKIVTASLEAMEDAVALGVEPIGAITVGDDFPSYLKDRLGADVANVGNKFGPDVEAVTALAPDVILGSTKFDDAVTASLTKIAPTINVSHQSTNWEANLRLMGQLAGKTEEAEQKITDYQADLTAFKEDHPDTTDQKAVMIRIRDGELCVYGENVYYNPTIYGDLGFQVPEELNEIEAQTTISVEQFAKWDVDLVFVQFSDEENAGNLDFLDSLKENAIWKSIPAIADNHVYYNIVDAGYQGGTYLSKEAFLSGASDKL